MAEVKTVSTITKEVLQRLANQVVKDAIANIGVEEKPIGSNWGRWIKKYLNSVDINYPAPWCAAFVYYRISTAANKLKITTKFIKTGYVHSIYLWAKKKKYLLDKPIAGCIFLQWNEGLNRYAHTGIVKDVNYTKNSFTTIEGNSNSDGSREGYCVCSNTRINHKGRYTFVKIV